MQLVGQLLHKVDDGSIPQPKLVLRMFVRHFAPKLMPDDERAHWFMDGPQLSLAGNLHTLCRCAPAVMHRALSGHVRCDRCQQRHFAWDL